MRYAKTLLLLALLLIPATWQLEEVRFNEAQTKDLNKVYESEQGYHDKSDWATLKRLHVYSRSIADPKLILFTSSECGESFLVHRELKRMQLFDKIVALNIEEKWVLNFARQSNIRETPALVVIEGSGWTSKRYITYEHEDIIEAIQTLAGK